jgi:hypothetical protein
VGIGAARVSTETPTLAAMTAAATALLGCLSDEHRAAACYPFEAEVRERWTYLPRPRPGVCLADLDRTQRKAASRLLATALSPHAYAQAMTIMALEEVVDRTRPGHPLECDQLQPEVDPHEEHR